MKSKWNLKTVVVVLAIITSIVAGVTVAKYVTQGTALDTARVAKWGVKIEAGTDVGGAFAVSYKDQAVTDNTATVTSKSSTVNDPEGNTTTVQDKVIAPGTNGTLSTRYVVTGTPEVAVKIERTVEIELEGWEIASGSSNAFYCPLVFTIPQADGTSSIIIEGKDFVTADDLKTELETKMGLGTDGKYEKTFDPGVNLAADPDIAKFMDADDTVTWEWPFFISEANDVMDTALGDAVNAPTISITTTVTATQID